MWSARIMFHKSKFCYIKPIQLLPARTDVVKETMKRSIDIANTVKQRQAFVAYNLEIAKIAKKNTIWRISSLW